MSDSEPGKLPILEVLALPRLGKAVRWDGSDLAFEALEVLLHGKREEVVVATSGETRRSLYATGRSKMETGRWLCTAIRRPGSEHWGPLMVRTADGNTATVHVSWYTMTDSEGMLYPIKESIFADRWQIIGR